MKTYIYRWTEGDRGPYEVRGNALSVYRASIMIGSGREHVQGQVLDSDGVVPEEDTYMQDVTNCLAEKFPEFEKYKK